MKKTLMRTFLSLTVIALLFPSCLGDSDSSVERNNALAYIKTGDAGKYADVLNAYITSDEINRLDQGRFYYISYKYATNNMGAGGAYKADYVNVSNNDQFIPEAEPLRFSVPPVGDTYVGVTSISPVMTVGIERFDNKWVVKFNALVIDGQKLVPHFYFNEENQFDKPSSGATEGDLIGKEENKVVVDVRFTVEGTATPGKTATEKSFEHVVSVNNLTSLMGHFTEGKDTQYIDDHIVLAVKLRYSLVKDKTKPTELTEEYVGQWSQKDSGSTPPYSVLKSKK